MKELHATTITPIPATVSPETIRSFLHDHERVAKLNPLVTSIERLQKPPQAALESNATASTSSPSNASTTLTKPNSRSASNSRSPSPSAPATSNTSTAIIPFKTEPDDYYLWYDISDRLEIVPGLSFTTYNFSYQGGFHDEADGLQTWVLAPMGVELFGRWTVERAPPAPSDHDPDHLDAPSNGNPTAPISRKGSIAGLMGLGGKTGPSQKPVTDRQEELKAKISGPREVRSSRGDPDRPIATTGTSQTITTTRPDRSADGKGDGEGDREGEGEGNPEAAAQNWQLREDVYMRCGALMAAFTRRNLQAAHRVLADRLMVQAEQFEGKRWAEAGKVSQVPS